MSCKQSTKQPFIGLGDREQPRTHYDFELITSKWFTKQKLWLELNSVEFCFRLYCPKDLGLPAKICNDHVTFKIWLSSVTDVNFLRDFAPDIVEMSFSK